MTNQGPIFVVGMNGSGTTMMLDHLNSHSAIYGFPEETRILPHYLRTLPRYGELSNDDNMKQLWLDMCKSFPFWCANSSTPVPLPTGWESLGRSPYAVFDSILKYFAAQDKKSIWCEKTPMHALLIDRLNAGFRGARFIHMIRDGRDCAASFHRRWGYDPRVTIYRWRKTIDTAQQTARRSKPIRYIEVRFEDLTTEPEATLRTVLEFLSLHFEDNVLKSRRSSSRMRGIDSKQLRPNSGAYKSYFSTRDLERLEHIAGRRLHELAYATDNTSGNNDLPRAYIALQQARTYFSRLGDVLRRAKHSKHPWKLFFGRVRTGLRHILSNKH